MAYFNADDGAQIFYSDEGAGVPVLCLSGLTRNSHDFDYVTPHLLKMGARVIRMDYRGRGQSDWPGPGTYTVPQESKDALDLLDHLGIERAGILGTSRGGLISMVLGATAKDRLLGVALNDIGPDLDASGLDDIKGYLGHHPRAKTYDEMLPLRAAALPGFDNVPESRWYEDMRANYDETPDGLRNRYDNRLREAVLSTDLAPDLWPFFANFTGLPLAVIWGMNSNLLSGETVAKMQTVFPDLILGKVPDRGHVPFLDEDESLAALSSWVKAIS